MEGETPFRKEGRGKRRSNSFSGVFGAFSGISRTTLKVPGEDDAEEEESDGIEASPSPVGESQGTGGPTLAQSNQPVLHQYEQSVLAIM
ncbi:hypothetical protein O181_020924 [Austropuccinia psidii MF-1]|uniref:Uncharacterized protein n=1 Tax=Austropuccinia psidii MF-1 TaxID=1389203 RepID=A0A9Q3GW60_9BASI|nr:hypothetical protein [Austropuccinia psidii MF-1]